MLKFFKILLALVTAIITYSCGNALIKDLTFLIQFSSFVLRTLYSLPLLLAAVTGTLTCLYHIKTYPVLLHYENNSQTQLQKEIPKLYWKGTKAFAISLVVLIIFTVAMQLMGGYIQTNIIGIIILIGITMWMTSEVRNMESMYKEAIRPKESILDQIGQDSID